MFTPWWRHHDDVADGTDLHLLVKLIPDLCHLCLGHCMSHYQYLGKVVEYKKLLLLLLTVGFGDFFLFCKPFFSLVLKSGSSTTNSTAGRFNGENCF